MIRKLFAIAACVLCVGCSRQSTAEVVAAAPEQSRPLPTAPIDILPLYADYKNEAAGDVKYKDKWITLKGSAKFVNKNADGQYVVGIRLYPGEPHVAEITFPALMADAVSKIKTTGKTAPEHGCPEYVFHARCIGRKFVFGRRQPLIEESKYIVLFDSGEVVR